MGYYDTRTVYNCGGRQTEVVNRYNDVVLNSNIIFPSHLRHADKREFFETQVLVLPNAFFHLTFVDSRRRQRSQRHAVAQEHDYVFGDAFSVHVLDFLGHRDLAVFEPKLTVCEEEKNG